MLMAIGEKSRQVNAKGYRGKILGRLMVMVIKKKKHWRMLLAIKQKHWAGKCKGYREKTLG